MRTLAYHSRSKKQRATTVIDSPAHTDNTPTSSLAKFSCKSVTGATYNQPQACNRGCNKKHAKEVLKLVHFTENFIIIISCIRSKGQQNFASLTKTLFVAVLPLAHPV
jgi:hypothetical protein